MSVTFGKTKATVFGNQTALTKQIRKHGFRVDTDLDSARIRELILSTCENFPPKEERLIGTFGPRVINNSFAKNVISYGHISIHDKNGKKYVKVTLARWSLVLAEAGDHRALRLSTAKLANGSIQEVEEMEHFVNELEQNMQVDDATASITLAH